MVSSYGLAEIKDSEALMLFETVIENGSEVEEAIADMKMLDTLLHMKKLFFVTHCQTSRTRHGHLRKGSTLYIALEGIIEGRANNKF